LVVALPATAVSSAQAALATVQVLDANVSGPNTSALPQAPADISAAQKGFLDKYQPASNAASEFIGQKNSDKFTSAGYCYAQYPCFSVQNGAVVSIGTAPAITQDQVSALLDQILASPNVTFAEGKSANSLTGTSFSAGNTVLDIVSPPGMVPPNVVAGMAFDLYKMQAGGQSTNSVRGLQAASDNAPYANVALCLYPSGVDQNSASNFCSGKEPDGSVVSAGSKLAKRFSLDEILTAFCSHVDIPILCP
jgi:hypothetical protein